MEVSKRVYGTSQGTMFRRCIASIERSLFSVGSYGNFRLIHICCTRKLHRYKRDISIPVLDDSSRNFTKPTTTTSRRRRRLDEICLEQYPQYSRNIIQSWILQGKVLVDDRPVTKTGTQVSAKSTVKINAETPKYVCRAGFKLEAALNRFDVEVSGKRALDSGLSTGGFTDCLLQNGAKEVIGVDVGYGQVAEKIRKDSRVKVMERTNVRYLRLTDLPGEEPVEVVTLDLSFISVVKVLDTVCSVLKENGDAIVLIKPQFEAGKEQVSSGGVVRDAAVRDSVIEKVTQAFQARGFRFLGLIESPIKGASSGNIEFLAHFKRLP